MEEGISIIICCFNSRTRLRPTLKHLCLQKNILPTQCEVIVIDNASIDNTAEVAKEIWNSITSVKPSFKVLHEPKPGLSFARNKGIQEARFKYVLFCDDDNWLNDNYLHTAIEIMNSSSLIGALGGIGSPVFENGEPPYFWQNQYHTLAVGRQCEKEGDITNERGVLYGAGMVLNKAAYIKLIKKYQFEFQVSDRIGNSLMSSGDHELCLALKKVGYKIFYSEKLLFQHYMPKGRTTINYYKKLFLSFGKSNAMLMVYGIDHNNFKSIKNDYRYIAIRCCKNIVKSWLGLIFTGYYVSSNKYRYIDRIHFLYKNIGMLKITLIQKNTYKQTIKIAPLFNREPENTEL